MECDDGRIRPVFRAEMLGGDGVWREIELLVDTGADSTVICAQALTNSNLQLLPGNPIGGIGGVVETVSVQTKLRLMGGEGRQATFRGTYTAYTHAENLDLSILGRDILDMFVLIVDRRSNVVAIIGQDHTYTIHQRR